MVVAFVEILEPKLLRIINIKFAIRLGLHPRVLIAKNIELIFINSLLLLENIEFTRFLGE